MLVVRIAQALGWICARLPEAFARLFCVVVGDIVFALPTKRRSIGLSNLHHAFPERPAEWHRKIARESTRRLVETVLFALASPFISERRARRHIVLAPGVLDVVHEVTRDAGGGPRGGVALTPHITLFETIPIVPLLVPEAKGFGAIFRPFDNPHLNAWVLRTRQRWGLELLSRKAGFNRALALVREGGWIGILYDQNAGRRGALIPLFGRAASATDLPGLVCTKFKVPAVVFYTRRVGFWRGELTVEKLDCPPDSAAVTVASNLWLERYLRSSDDACADWFWTHKRWRIGKNPRMALVDGLGMKKDLTAPYLEAQGLDPDAVPRKTRLWVRLPNWLGDVVMALPLVRALRETRRDAELTLLCPAHTAPLLERLGVADRVLALPPKGPGYFWRCRRFRPFYPDVFLLFTNSLRGDLEARISGAPQRFGMLRPGRRRPFLTYAYPLPGDLDEAEEHQVRVWERFLRFFGLGPALDLAPLAWPAGAGEDDADDANAAPALGPAPVGLICGTENTPAKRWPVPSWRALIDRLPDLIPGAPVLLFGTANDAAITADVAAGHDPAQVVDLAGKTGLVAFAQKLAACRVVICNDTGGMHLANALGVPVAAVFGPTNPVRTGPVFDAPTRILQPEGCPPTGGAPIEGVTPEAVATAAAEIARPG